MSLTGDKSGWQKSDDNSAQDRLNYPWQALELDTADSTPQNQLQKKVAKVKANWAYVKANWTWVDWLGAVLPCVSWLRSYPLNWLISDIIGGLSVGFLLVPQSLSYATTAGLPAVWGLYGGFVPCLLYFGFGTSRQLAVGPVAVTSVLIQSQLSQLLPCTSPFSNSASTASLPVGAVDIACQTSYNNAATQLAFIVACLYTGIGVLQMGWLTKFLGHAIISGFMSGAAITIGSGQVKYILGYKINMINGSTKWQDYWYEYTKKARNLRWQEYIMGVMFIYILVLFKYSDKIWSGFKYVKNFGPLFVSLAGIAGVYLGAINTIDRGAISIVGNIPAGLPPITVQNWSPMPLAGTNGPSFTDLIVPAIIVMFVDLLESTSIARAMAKLNGYELPYTKEIVALGICNFGGAAFNAYTTTGSFSRSSVSNTAGSKSPLSQFFCAWVVGFTLIFLTGFFANVPYNVLGAIIVVAVAQLVEYTVPFKLWKTNKLDLACWLAAFLAVLFISVEIGLAVAIGLAILITLYQTAFPHTAVLGKIGTASGSAIFRNIKQYPDSQLFPGILLFRIDAPVYFGNARSISDKIEKLIKRYNGWSAIQGLTDGIKFLVIDLTPVQYLDTMGIHLFEDLVFDTKKKGIQLLLANPNKAVVQDLEKVRFSELIGRENLFVSLHDAFQYAQQRLVELGYSANPVPIGRKGAPKDLEVDKQLLAADLPPIFPHGKATKRVVAEKDHITDA